MAEQLKDRLTHSLTAKGWSQARLAQVLKVSPASVSAWCNGTKNPTPANLSEIARHLGVTPSYLQYGHGPKAEVDLEPDRVRYASDLQWYWREAPRDGGRELGNPAGFAFTADMETLGREATQNSLDERRVAEPTVKMDYSVIELTGDSLASFLETFRFDSDVRPHVEAAAAMESQKVSAVLKGGLRHLDDDRRLILLRISDYNANGLMGPEYESGQFMAVVRNVLDSYKRENAGGSYGLGKATLSACSRFGLVLINSTLAEAEDGKREGRFIGRIELPWHTLPNGDVFAGPGWFGELDPDRGSTRSYWGNPAVAHDMLLERSEDAPGTTFLIVAAYDPSGAAETIEEMAETLRRAVAQNFWPAMVDGPDVPSRLSVVVRAERNGKTLTEHFVDPEQYEPAKVAALRTYYDNGEVSELKVPGDVVKKTVSLRVPKRTAPGSEHGPVEHEPILLVVQADDGDEDANHVAYLRGSHMVIRNALVQGLPVGAQAFHAIVLAGEAAGNTPADRSAERFLRAAEPPAHNLWTSTPDLTTSYARGGATAIKRMEEQVRKAIRELVRQPANEESDGPESLKELLRLLPPKPEAQPGPKIKSAQGSPDATGAWNVEATISLPVKAQGWSLVPLLRFGTESGPPITVRWREITPVQGCRWEDSRIICDAGVRSARFRGITDPASHPVAASRAKVLVDIRTDAGVAESGATE